MASQLRREYKAKNERMEQYLKLAQSLMAAFQQFVVAQVPRAKNRMVDALASLASNALYLCHMEISIMDHPSIYCTAVLTAESQVRHFWMSSISSYLRSGTLPEDRSKEGQGEGPSSKVHIDKRYIVHVIIFWSVPEMRPPPPPPPPPQKRNE